MSFILNAKRCTFGKNNIFFHFHLISSIATILLVFIFIHFFLFHRGLFLRSVILSMKVTMNEIIAMEKSDNFNSSFIKRG